MIAELMTLLKDKKKMSLTDLSVLAKQKVEVTEQIMEQLVRKGKVKKEAIACFGCMKECSACVSRSDLIYYEIIEDETGDPKSN
jgi:hypothetical protein